MKKCQYLREYLLGSLHGTRLAEFKDHLSSCSSCRKQMEEWRELKETTLGWAASRRLKNPTTAEAARFVVALQPRNVKTAPWLRPAFYAGLVASAAVMAFFIVISKSNSGGEQAETKIAKNEAAAIEVAKRAMLAAESAHREQELPIKVLFSEQCELSGSPDTFARELSVPGKGSLVFEIGKDRIGLGARSNVKILKAARSETKLKLGRGKVAVKVEPREQSGSFSVEAGIFAVKALGTRFEVSMTSVSKIKVSVEEGRVLVEGPGETLHEINEGQVLKIGKEGAWSYASLKETGRRELNALLNPELRKSEEEEPGSKEVAAKSRKPEYLPLHTEEEIASSKEPVRDMNAWRSLILDGSLARAKSEIEEYLGVAPEDASAWSMLANCARKMRDWDGALEAYRRVIKYGSAHKAASARFDAAAILQDKFSRHAEATALYYEYLQTPLLLEAEAMVRLSRSLLATGRDKEAKGMLQRVISNHKGTSAALEASRLLDDLGN